MDFTNAAGWQVQQLSNLEQGAGCTAWTVRSPALPGASGNVVTNPYAQDAIVVVVGGTVTAVAVSPNGMAGTFVTDATSTPAAVKVAAAGAIQITYSAAPTAWYWLTIPANVAETDN